MDEFCSFTCGRYLPVKIGQKDWQLLQRKEFLNLLESSGKDLLNEKERKRMRDIWRIFFKLTLRLKLYLYPRRI